MIITETVMKSVLSNMDVIITIANQVGLMLVIAWIVQIIHDAHNPMIIRVFQRRLIAVHFASELVSYCSNDARHFIENICEGRPKLFPFSRVTRYPCKDSYLGTALRLSISSHVVFCFEPQKPKACIDMTASSRAHVHYGIGLVPIDFYILNRNDSKKLIEYCLREGCIIKDFICTCDKCIDIEKISQEMLFSISNKNVFIHLDKRAPIVNVLDKGLMAVIEILKIEEE